MPLPSPPPRADGVHSLERTDDLRSLPDHILQAYLYGVGLWGLALIGLYIAQLTAWAMPLCFVVFVWQALLTGYWGHGLTRRFDAGDIGAGEARAGVQSVTRLLIGSSLLPVLVFLVEDPLAASSWTAAGGNVVVAGLAWGGSSLSVRIPHRAAHVITLAIAALTLPVNATGSIGLGVAAGWFDRVLL